MLPAAESRPAPSLISSPRFNLDLSEHLVCHPPSLSFAAAKQNGAAKPQPERPGLQISFGLGRLLFVTQCLIVIVLVMMVGGLIYWSSRLSTNVTYYYNTAEPYLNEARDRGMSIIKHADASSASMETAMAGAAALAQQSGPLVLDSLNRTARVAERLESVAKNPVVKLSLA